MHLRAAEFLDVSKSGGSSPTTPRFPHPISHHRDDKLSNNLYNPPQESVAALANSISTSSRAELQLGPDSQGHTTLYSPEERLRRDATRWTLVQGILAPVQFAAFLISLTLVVRYLASGDGFFIASVSIVIKTLLLYAIMITGSIWEREVFGCYLFAPAFFWEDVFSFLVLALHTAYLVALFAGVGSPRQQMFLALAAYASYFINATQFILKLRAARRDERMAMTASSVIGGRA